MTPSSTSEQAITSPALGVRHGFFGRIGGVSTGLYKSMNCGYSSGDADSHVTQNRARIAAALGVVPPHLITLHQIHSAEAVTVTGEWTPETAPRADAMVTNSPGLALGILTADCVPVLFADTQNYVIGAAHAGWKGALSGIIEATVERMYDLGAARENIRAAIGPSISQKNYEVGPELRLRFCDAEPENTIFFMPSDTGHTDHWRFDLPGYVEKRMEMCGIHYTDNPPPCTYSLNDKYFSYRRATHRHEPDYGRNISAIVLDAF